jgi:hypothetical protein
MDQTSDNVLFVWSFSYVQCGNCGRILQDGIEHHVCYDPEIKTFVCPKCHGAIHRPKNVARMKHINALKREGQAKRLEPCLIGHGRGVCGLA